HVAAEWNPTNLVSGLAPLGGTEAEEGRAEADAKRLHVHVAPFGGDEVTEFVDEDDQAKADDDLRDVHQVIAPTIGIAKKVVKKNRPNRDEDDRRQVPCEPTGGSGRRGRRVRCGGRGGRVVTGQFALPPGEPTGRRPATPPAPARRERHAGPAPRHRPAGCPGTSMFRARTAPRPPRWRRSAPPRRSPRGARRRTPIVEPEMSRGRVARRSTTLIHPSPDVSPGRRARGRARSGHTGSATACPAAIAGPAPNRRKTRQMSG